MTTKWLSIYEDKTTLNQFDEDGKEHLFKEIEESKLKEFALFHNEKVISLFPKQGVFGINGLIYKTDLSEQDLDYRLIHFSRRRKIMGPKGNNENEYFVGFQVNKDGKNHKRLISVCNNEIKIIKE